jgi:hypothetical protein
VVRIVAGQCMSYILRSREFTCHSAANGQRPNFVPALVPSARNEPICVVAQIPLLVTAPKELHFPAQQQVVIIPLCTSRNNGFLISHNTGRCGRTGKFFNNYGHDSPVQCSFIVSILDFSCNLAPGIHVGLVTAPTPFGAK